MTRDEAIEIGKLLKDLIEVQEISIILNTFLKAFKEKSIDHHDGRWYLHGNFNLGGTVSGRMSCVAAHTPILTDRGKIPIKDVVTGDKVLTHRGNWKHVTDTVIKGVGLMWKVTFCNGEVLTCTSDHKILTSDNQWKSIGEYLNVSQQKVDIRSKEYLQFYSTLPEYDPDALYGSNCPRVRYNISKCACRIEDKPIRRRISSNKKSKIFSFKNGKQKPNERQKWYSPSQLYWGMRRWLRISNNSLERKKAICTSSRNDETSWDPRIANWMGSPSHRQQPIKQQYRQFISLYVPWPSSDTFLTKQGQPGTKISKIEYSGSREVYDITVEDDASYFACGVFSHNSSKPNLQNIPSTGTKYAKLIKGCFKAPEGWLLMSADFSSLEDRISALTTKDPNKLKVYLEGYDGHSYRAFNYYREQMPDIVLAQPGEKCFKITHDDGTIEYKREEEM